MRSRSRLILVATSIWSLLACSPAPPTTTASPPGSTLPSAAGNPSKPAPTATPIPSGPIPIATLAGRIVFTRAGSQYGDDTVFVIDADGTGEREVLDVNQACCPRFSPDGTQILVPWGDPDGQRLTTAVIGLDGSLLRRFTLPQGPVSIAGGTWSADGKRLALVGFDDADPSAGGIYVARASDGGDLRLVTKDHGQLVDFSPDGKRIFYHLPVDTFPAIGDQKSGSLWAVNVDGTGRRRVTPADVSVENISGNDPGRLSPDGQAIAFTSAGNIWTIKPDGSHLAELFADAEQRIAINPTWSPDGAFILFGLDPANSLATAETPSFNGLYVIRRDGSDLTPLLLSKDWKREPEWRPAS